MREYRKRSIVKLAAVAVTALAAAGATGMARSTVENFSFPVGTIEDVLSTVGNAALAAALPYSPSAVILPKKPSDEPLQEVVSKEASEETSSEADNESYSGSVRDDDSLADEKTDSEIESQTESAAQENASAVLLSMNVNKTIENLEGVFDEKSGEIRETTYGTVSGNGAINLEHGQIRNCTELDDSEIEEIVSALPDINIEDDGPQVLIMHTHTTESYEPGESGYYDSRFTGRSLDPRNSVVGVGAEIAVGISEAGIGVIHDGTVYDDPIYNYSYSRSAERVKEILSQYPSVKVVLDIHRDGIADGDVRIAPVTEIDGKKAAQIMIICGCDDGTDILPEFRENLKFAAYIENSIEKDYPTLTRPLLFDYRFYNQDLTTGSILIEVGALGNNMAQARYTGQLLGKTIGKALGQLR